MKLLVISHACITSINQQFYAEVERQTGWSLTIVTPENWQNEYGKILSLERWPEYQGKLLSIPVWKSGNVPLHIYRSFFLNLLKEVDPDFIYVQHEPYAIGTSQIYLANRLSINKPIAFFTWQNIFKCYPFPFQQLENWVLRESCLAFPGSQSAEVVLRRKGFAGESIILPGGIDLTRYFPNPKAEQLKHELGARGDEILIGYVGRIVEEKGLKTLLHAVNQIQSLPWQLVVIGSGPYEAEFDAIANDLQLTHRIKRLGYIPHTETPLYLSALDVLVLPSETRLNWKEQFGRVIIESIACGTPVVGSDSGEIPYLIKTTGGGMIFPEGKSVALAEKFERLILDVDLRLSLACQGTRVVSQKYTNTFLAQHFICAIERSINLS
jgi:L-malate glycosyltransferase